MSVDADGDTVIKMKDPQGGTWTATRGKCNDGSIEISLRWATRNRYGNNERIIYIDEALLDKLLAKLKEAQA